MWNFHSFVDLILLCDSTAEKVTISRSTQKGQTVKRLYDGDTKCGSELRHIYEYSTVNREICLSVLLHVHVGFHRLHRFSSSSSVIIILVGLTGLRLLQYGKYYKKQEVAYQ